MNDKPSPHKNNKPSTFTLRSAILSGTAGVAGAAGALAAANKFFKGELKRRQRAKRSPHKD